MKIQLTNPSTEEIIKEIEVTDKKILCQIVRKARTCLHEWKKCDISEREQILKKFSEILKKKENEVAELISKEVGKPIRQSEGEVEGSFNKIEWFVSETKKFIQDEEIDVDAKDVDARVVFDPVGVVGLITPWNFPLSTPMSKIIPALLTGNTVVFKPSELSTLSGLKIDESLHETGIPEGVFNTIIGDRATGKYLVRSKVNMISFTGSSIAGKEVYSEAGRGLKKVVLELGGSDPFIIFSDAVLERAVNAVVFGRFFNCGQVCTSAKRIFVDEKLYDSFLEKFVDKVEKLRVGDPLDRNTEVGPLVSQKQLETLEEQVKDAVDKGATVVCGGKRLEGKGYFYEPTILTNIKTNMLVMREEVFGPVASVLNFSSIKQAISFANGTSYGLGASVWTQNIKTSERMARSIESGMVSLNIFGTPYPECPQGGIKESGLGRELSKYGIREFCNMKTVVRSSDQTTKKYLL